MSMLDDLLGGGQRQKEYGDFVKRYEQGDPSEGYSDQEVLERYGEVSHAVSPDQYAQAAQEALSKLSPEERAAFVKMLQDRAATRSGRDALGFIDPTMLPTWLIGFLLGFSLCVGINVTLE